MTTYDRIGHGLRRRCASADPRIAAHVEAALGDALGVVNVGAGAGLLRAPPIATSRRSSPRADRPSRAAARPLLLGLLGGRRPPPTR